MCLAIKDTKSNFFSSHMHSGLKMSATSHIKWLPPCLPIAKGNRTEAPQNYTGTSYAFYSKQLQFYFTVYSLYNYSSLLHTQIFHLLPHRNVITLFTSFHHIKFYHACHKASDERHIGFLHNLRCTLEPHFYFDTCDLQFLPPDATLHHFILYSF